MTAAANLRANVFGITPQSKFDIKSIAGNIIPAIAATNAIVAGLQVLEAVKVLRKLDLQQHCHTTFCLRHKTRRGKLLMASRLDPPNPRYERLAIVSSNGALTHEPRCVSQMLRVQHCAHVPMDRHKGHDAG